MNVALTMCSLSSKPFRTPRDGDRPDVEDEEFEKLQAEIRAMEIGLGWRRGS